MIEVLKLQFTPEPGHTEIGKMDLVIKEVSVYEAIRGGYYMVSPLPAGTISNPLNATLADAGIDEQLKAALGVERSNEIASVPLMNWMQVLSTTKVTGTSTHDHSQFKKRSATSLEHFETIQFITDLPENLKELLRKIRKPDMFAITARATYDDVVRLAVQKVKQHWQRPFVDQLLRRIARGTATGGFVQWGPMRETVYTLKPALRGTLKKWDDYKALPLETVFQPEDFEKKDDVVVAEALREKVINYSAFLETFCVPGVYNDREMFLHWNYRYPNGKDPLPHWSTSFTGDSLWWRLDYSGSRADMNPQKGLTVSRLQKIMAYHNLPQIDKLPYQVKWEELDTMFQVVLPIQVETGLQITCDIDEIPVAYLNTLKPIDEIPASTLQHALQTFGITPKASDDAAELFGDLLTSLFSSFEKEMDRVMKDKPMVRVNMENMSMRPTGSTTPMTELFVPNSTHPLVVDYLVAFYLCMHTRGKSILDANFRSELYSEQGVFHDLLRTGYPPAEASFASGTTRVRGQARFTAPKHLTFACPYGLPEGVDWSNIRQENSTVPVQSVVQQDDGMDELDDLLADL